MAGHATANRKSITLYADTDFDTANPTYAQLTTAASGVVIAANQVPCVRSADDLEASGNVASYTCLGENTERNIAGAQSFGEWGFNFNADETNAQAKKIGDLAVGSAIQVGIRIMTGVDNDTIRYIRGEVASNSDVGFNDDTPVQKRVTIAMSQAPLSVSKP